MPDGDRKSKMFIVSGGAAGPTSPAGDTPYKPDRGADNRHKGWAAHLGTPVRMSESLVNFSELEWCMPNATVGGRSYHSKIKIHPVLAGLIAEIVASREFPYHTSEDLEVHALERHVRWLHGIKPDVGRDAYAVLTEIQAIVKEEELKSLAEADAVALLKRLKELMANGSIEHAKQVADRLRAVLVSCAPGRLRDEQQAIVEAQTAQIIKQIDEKYELERPERERKEAEVAAAAEEAEALVYPITVAAATKHRTKPRTESVPDESDYKVTTYGPPPDLE